MDKETKRIIFRNKWIEENIPFGKYLLRTYYGWVMILSQLSHNYYNIVVFWFKRF